MQSSTVDFLWNYECLLLSRTYIKDEYNSSHGGKWPVENLKLYIEGTRGKEVYI